MNPVTKGRGAPDGVPPLHVLCVDDNRDVADSTVDLLRVMGFEASACYDGPSALAELAAFRPGVCLIDLNMPGMDGDELAVLIREQGQEPPLILVAVTAMSNEASCRRIHDAGFDLHLIKPVDPNQLVRVVDRLWRVWQASERSSCTARRASGDASTEE